MAGRFAGEFWSRDIGLAIAFKRRIYGRYRWELFALIGPLSLSVGFVRNRWYR
jgi:hypothetical protein